MKIQHGGQWVESPHQAEKQVCYKSSLIYSERCSGYNFMEVVPNVSGIQKNASSAIVLFSPNSSTSLLGFSSRSFNALIKNGYNTIEKVLSLDKKLLETIENISRKSIKEILTVQEQLRRQIITVEEDYLENINVPDCRFVYTKESIYSTDYIGVLDISFEAHNVLYNAGIFSAGKLFNMKKEDVYNLKNSSKEISEELFAFITKENPLTEKIEGDEDLENYIQKMTQEQQNYRMSILQESYNKIPQDRLDKPLSPFLQNYDAENIQYSITRLSPVLKKTKAVKEIKTIFPFVVKTSRTNDVLCIQKALSFNLIEFLNDTLESFFVDPQYTNSLEILYQRASGFTLQDIAEKRKLTRERIRQIELKSTEKLIGIIRTFQINILSFICADTVNNDYISVADIREYLAEFRYNSQIIYILKNENIYKEYQYNRQYDVFYHSGLELDFASLDIQNPIRELILDDKETETGKKIEDFLIEKKLAKCTYNEIFNFTGNEAGYTKVNRIIQLTNNIVEIEKDWYVHRSCIIDFDEAAEKLLVILRNHFKHFYGYSNSHILFDAANIDLSMFMNDNGFETEPVIYMLTKHLFLKEKYKCHHFFFTENLHIWEKQTYFPQNNKGILINFAETFGGIITREDTENYLENLKFSKNVIINKIHDVSDSTFYFYEESTYILSKYFQTDEAFIFKIKKSLDKLIDNREYIIPGDIDEYWFDTLPELPLGLSWNLLLLQEIIRYNDEIGYKPLFSDDIDQSPYRISGAFVKIDSAATLVDIIYIYTYESLELPYKDTAEKYRKLLRKAGFIHDMEWFGAMHKVFDDPRFAFSNDNKNILVRK